jgi:hypothetical protein
MSVAGVHSNRGDAYQTALALKWVIEMLVDAQIVWIEVDSTSLSADRKPIPLDDIVVRFRNGDTRYIQCKKNQPDYNSWTVAGIRVDLLKAARALTADLSSRVIFYSRSPFGELGKLREHAKTQPDGVAYRQSLSKSLAASDAKLGHCWADELPASSSTYDYLKRVDFETTPEIEAINREQLALLAKHVTQAPEAFDTLWTRLEHLGARIGQSSATESTNRFTREELLTLLEKCGSTIAPVRLQVDLEAAFADVSAIGRSWKRDIRNHRIRRDAVDDLLAAVRARERSVVLSDGPGSGKTCVLLDFLDALTSERDVAAIFIQARAHTEAERENHGLMHDLVGQISRMAELRHTVVVIDSLDVLSLARDHSALSFFLRVLDQLSRRAHVTVIAACRTFDLQYDRRLADREWSRVVNIGPLRWTEEIKPLLEGWGIDPEGLGADTRALLTNPRNLALFADIAKRAGSYDASTAQALTRRYLDVIVRQDAALGETCLVQLEAMAQQLLAERRLEVPRRRIGLSDDALARLLSAEVLHQSESGLISFGHQTLLDALAVARVEGQGVSLLAFIRSLPAVPFMRPAVRAFFAYLRLTDYRAFRTQVRAVFDADVAYHLKRLVAESFADVAPEPEDWGMIQQLFRKDAALFRRLHGATKSNAWHAFWHERWVPIMMTERNPGLLTEHVYQSAGWQKSNPSAILAFWLWALRCDWAHKESIRKAISAQLEGFDAWNEAGVRALFELLLVPPSRELHDLGKPLSRYVQTTSSGEDLLWQHIAGRVTDEDVTDLDLKAQLRSAPYEFCDEEFLVRRFKSSELLLDNSIGALEHWSHLRSESLRTAFLMETSYLDVAGGGEKKTPSAVGALLDAVQRAVIHHALADTRWWSRNGRRLARSSELALQYFAIRACIAAPQTNRELIRQMLSDRTIIESALCADLCELMRVSFWWLDDASQDDVMRLILDFARTKRSASRDHLLPLQAALLSAMPSNLRSADAHRRLLELERRFWPIECARLVNRSFEPEKSPLSGEHLKQMSDSGVVRLLTYYREEARSQKHADADWSNRVATPLSRAARHEPARFMRILAESWNHIPDDLRKLLLIGADEYLEFQHDMDYQDDSAVGQSAERGSTAELNRGAVVSLILDELERHRTYWRHSREAAHAIRTCAFFVDARRDAARIVEIARELRAAEEPRLEPIDPNEFVRMGQNSTRGMAAEALVALGTRWATMDRSLPDDFHQCLLAYASDKHPAVRAILLCRLPGLVFHNSTIGWSVFARAVAHPSEHLWSIAEGCLYSGTARDFDTVARYLQQIDAAGMGKAATTWGRVSAIACLAGLAPWEELFERLLTLKNNDAWGGAVDAFVQNVGYAHHRAACFEGLIAGLERAPEPSAFLEQMRVLFRERESGVVPVPDKLVKLCFSAIEHLDHSRGLLVGPFEEWIADLADAWPDLALAAGNVFADFVGRTNVVVYDHRPTATMLTRLFREAEEREESDSGAMLAQIIRLQDALLSAGVWGLEQWLTEAERP